MDRVPVEDDGAIEVLADDQPPGLARRTVGLASGTVAMSSGSQPVPGRQCSGEWMLTPGCCRP